MTGADCRGRGDAHRLPRQGSLADEVARFQHGDDGFLAGLGDNGEFYRAFLDVHHVLADVSLGEDGVLRLELRNGSCHAGGIEEGLDIELAVVRALSSFLLCS